MSGFDPITGEELPDELGGAEEPVPGDEATDTPATDGNDAGAEPELDFLLTAEEAAALVSEAHGEKVSVAAFQRMVMRGHAPAPLPGKKTNQWSQRALDAWLYPQATGEGAQGLTADGLPAPQGPVHENVYDFFTRTFSPYYELFNTDPAPLAAAKEAARVRWCEKWWLHRGVVGRMTACWFAWEAAHASKKPAMSLWILDHADRHFDRIMAETGAFSSCLKGHADLLTEYETREPPFVLQIGDAGLTAPRPMTTTVRVSGVRREA
jgi:hypothetical protein